MAQEGAHRTGDVGPSNEVNRMAGGDIARRAANRTPTQQAFIVPAQDETVTYEVFNRRANRAAQAFRASGLAAGDRLAVVGGNSLQFLTTYFGALKAGIVVTPLNPEITAADLGYELDHAEADAVIVDDVLYPKVDPLVGDRDIEIIAAIDWGGEDVPVQSFRTFIEDYSETEPPVEIRDDDVAQIMYTSGTTSRPKGVLLSHKAITTGSVNVSATTDLSRHDVMSCVMPLFHCAQLTMVKGAMHVSATVVVRRSFDPDGFLADVEDRGLTWSFMLPAMYNGLLARDDIDDRDLSSLDYCLYAMAPIGNETLERAIEVFDADFALGSGQTEAYPPTCVYHPEWQLEKQGNYWGRAAALTDIEIMDDDGSLLPQGEIGEIVYRGPNVMDGYLKNEAATAEAFAHGWFHSGDMGFFDEDGLLKFVDRKKDMIKSGGENVSTQKVESLLLDHPSVAEVAIVGLPHERWGEAVTAFVVPDEGADASPEDILEYSSEHLAGFETPKSVEFVDELPKTSTGKIQKFQLAEREQEYYRERDD
ncbi:MAG: long-chain acyl-CoA synthetase [Natronomonas sp.]|jgi:long-chain acyl-CoA synthetase|uniref:class I adenylate-forming enzyme family protein n=1 Tax=Natronomonas sp. TaxID=2184060 RepID=UPI00398A193A